MKLSELNERARRAGFDPRRIQRVHSSLYRLDAEIPVRYSANYYASKTDTLYAALFGAENFWVVGHTTQLSFGHWGRFPVYARKEA
jgi:hypothetical protein